MLTDDGFILLTRTHPIRYAIERSEQNGTTLGEEYFSTDSFAYRHRNWDDAVTLTKKPYTIADLLNLFGAAGLWVESAVEPQMPAEVGQRYPHKQAAITKYLGILMFRLRPLPTRPQSSATTRAAAAESFDQFESGALRFAGIDEQLPPNWGEPSPIFPSRAGGDSRCRSGTSTRPGWSRSPGRRQHPAIGSNATQGQKRRSPAVSMHSTVMDAVRAARKIQVQGGQIGVGVALDDGREERFVQWVDVSQSADGWTVERIEVSVKDPTVQRYLAECGFRPDKSLRKYDIWVDGSKRQSWASEEEVLQYLCALLELLGASDGVALTVYP